jgi:hypothetical protein
MRKRIPIIALFLLLVGLGAAACGSSGGQGNSMPSLSITSPANGASTAAPFLVTVKSSVPLGDPSTGKDHVHVWFDGHESQYTIGYSDRIQIKGVSPGQHKMTVSLRNPNHSAVGVDQTITITVAGTGPSPGTSPAPSPGQSSSGGNGGYGY